MSKNKNTGLKKVTTKSTDLILSGEPKQENVPALLAMVNARITALEGEDAKTVRITSELSPFGVISDITDLDVLEDAYAHVSRKESAIMENRHIFTAISGKDRGTVKIGEHTAEEWQEEIKTQYRKTTFKDKLSKLKEAKAELESCLSEEYKVVAKVGNAINILKS